MTHIALLGVTSFLCGLATGEEPVVASPRLQVFPPQIELLGAGAEAHFIVTRVDVTRVDVTRIDSPSAPSGTAPVETDVTRTASIGFASEGIAQRVGLRRIVAVADGETRLLVEHENLRVEVPVLVREASTPRPLHFARDVVPVLSRLGCNAGGCHGKSGGQNGFQLSLFGYDPDFDYRSLRSDARGRRIFPPSPSHSLLLRKTRGDLPHGGGALLAKDSAEYALLERWIAAGAPAGDPAAPDLVRVEVDPQVRVLARGAEQPLVVTAVYADGRREDVTRLAQLSVNDESLLAIDESAASVVALSQVGTAAALVRFRGRIASFLATVTSGARVDSATWPAPKSFVDEHLYRRFAELGIEPSAPVDDAGFLRRASLQITGTTPSPAAIRAFLADPDPAKRERLIDRLVESDEYAKRFALYWADLLRNRRENQQAAALTIRFHRWLYEHLLANRPYDEIVRGVLCAEGNIVDTPAVAWYRESTRPERLVDDAAQVFLGTRIQCARCHHHPFERWSQEDYWHFANFFSRVRSRGNADQREFTVTLARGSSRVRDDEPTSASHGRTYEELALPFGPTVEDDRAKDPRHDLVDWLRDPENPLFARAVVNRYWKHFFGRGIVEPEDDLRETNPPSNPALLDALAADFIASGFDLRHLVRRICSSRAYEASSVPEELNRLDRQSFSRFEPRRLGAEVLVDAIDRALGTTTSFPGARRGTRAIELPDESHRNYLLEVFGRPDRVTCGACERAGDGTLSQALALVNSREVREKLRERARSLAEEEAALEKAREEAAAAAEGEAGGERTEAADTAALVDALVLDFFGRPARAEEIAKAIEYLDRTTDTRERRGSRERAWEDIAWALLNSKEFLFLR